VGSLDHAGGCSFARFLFIVYGVAPQLLARDLFMTESL